MIRETIFIFAWLLCAPVAFAVDSTSSSGAAPAAQSTFQQTLRKMGSNVRASYQFWLTGPNIRTLSGNVDGTGSNLTLNHYLGLGYKVGSKWTITATQPFAQKFDNKPSSEADPFVIGDPYLTFTNSRILGSDRYGTNLLAYIRYYAPLSRSTNQNVDKASAKDSGRGSVRLYVAPTKTWLDGALTLNLQFLLQNRFATRTAQDRLLANGTPNHDHLVFVFDPVLSYDFTPTYTGYVEYTLEMTRSSSGKWTKWKDADSVSLGGYVNATKKFLLNPYLESDPRFKELKNTRIGMQGVYRFL